jgi:hypothetical protein
LVVVVVRLLQVLAAMRLKNPRIGTEQAGAAGSPLERETAAPDSSSAVIGGRASRQRGRATAKAFPGADELKAPGFAPRIPTYPRR